MKTRRVTILLDFEPPTKDSTDRITALSVQTERRKWGCIHLLSYGSQTILPSADENPRHFATNLKTLGTITNQKGDWRWVTLVNSDALQIKVLCSADTGSFRAFICRASERPGKSCVLIVEIKRTVNTRAKTIFLRKLALVFTVPIIPTIISNFHRNRGENGRKCNNVA